MRRLVIAASLALTALPAGALRAQEPAGGADRTSEPRPIFLLLNQERILTDSARGKALLALEDAERERARSEGRAIETAFEEEERRLTEQRADLDPGAFRKLADAFDARVVAARRDQDARAAELAQEFDQRRREFYADVAPILVQQMERVGALAILDETTVLIADQSLNVTDEVIAELDRQSPARDPVAASPGGADAEAAPAPQAGAGGASE